MNVLLNKVKINDLETIRAYSIKGRGRIIKTSNPACFKTMAEIMSAKNGADRNSLIINLGGGGVVSDMGGFIASTYKRGIDYINIPTTLLSMVDASSWRKNWNRFRSSQKSNRHFL